MAQKQVVVIGSGPGGSSFAALMAHAGHRVTLLEKNEFAGGKCTSQPFGDYIVDTGVHMFGRGPKGPFGLITGILGEGPQWSRTLPSFTVRASGKGNMAMYPSMFHPMSGLALMKASLQGWFHQNMGRCVAKALSNYGPGGTLELFRKMADPRCPLYEELQDRTVEEFLSTFVASRDLGRMFHAQCMITTVLPWDRASAGEFMYILSSTMQAQYLSYPIGGSSEIPLSFLRAFKREGGVLRLGCEAARIDVADGKVRGVITRDGEMVPADYVVSNAGIKRTVALAGRESFPEEYAARVDALKESEAFIAVKLLLDRKLSSMRTPCMMHIPDLDPEHMFDYLKDGGIPSDLFLFITVPSIWDPMLAPPGKDALIVGVPAPSDLSRVDQCVGLLDLAERIAGEVFPEIKGHVVDKQRTHIAHTSHLTGRATGECIGLAQEVGQSGTRKPAPAMPVRGLYLVGSDAGGRGIGTENAAESALYLYGQLK
jgi:prolycopene isomerase